MKITIGIILIAGIIAFILFVPRTQDDEARRILESSGFTNVEITGFEPFMLGRDDLYSTGFSATSPTGQPVEGAVTGGGWMKGSTIRFK